MQADTPRLINFNISRCLQTTRTHSWRICTVEIIMPWHDDMKIPKIMEFCAINFRHKRKFRKRNCNQRHSFENKFLERWVEVASQCMIVKERAIRQSFRVCLCLPRPSSFSRAPITNTTKEFHFENISFRSYLFFCAFPLCPVQRTGE